MAGKDAYKLVVGVYLQDKSTAGVQEFERGLKKVQEQAKKLQGDLDKIGMGTGGARNVVAAQEQINKLNLRRADIAKQMALTTDKSQRATLESEDKALGLTVKKVAAEKAILSLNEKTYALANTQEDKRLKGATRIANEQLRGQRQWEAEQNRIAVEGERQEASATRKKSADSLRAFNEQMRMNKANNAWQMDAIKVEAAYQAKLAKQNAPAKASIVAEEGTKSRHPLGFLATAGASFLGNVGAQLSGQAYQEVSGAVSGGFKDTADLQQLLTTMSIGTGASKSQTDQLRQTAFDISNLTAQSATDSARLMAVMASSGLNKTDQIINLAPIMAKFADVQYYKRGTSFQESAVQATQLAHLFGAVGTTPKDLVRFQHLMERFTQVSFMMPDNLNRFVTQAGYYMPAFRKFGIKDDDALVSGAFMDRMGLGRGKGGTALANFVTQQLGAMAITGHVSGKRGIALNKLGLLNQDGTSKFYNNGQFDIFGSLQQLDKDVVEQTKGLKGHALDAKQQEIAKYIQQALGVTGGRVGFLGSNDSIKVLHDMVKTIRSAPSLESDQSKYMNNLGPSLQRATSNIRSLAVEALWPALGVLTKFFTNIGTAAHNFQVTLHQTGSFSKAITQWWNNSKAEIASGVIKIAAALVTDFLTGLENAVGSFVSGLLDWKSRLKVMDKKGDIDPTRTPQFNWYDKMLKKWDHAVGAEKLPLSPHSTHASNKGHKVAYSPVTNNFTLHVHASNDPKKTAEHVVALLQHGAKTNGNGVRSGATWSKYTYAA